MKQASPKKMCPIKQSIDQSKQRICSNFVPFHSFRGIRFYGFIGFDSIMNKNIRSNSIEVYFFKGNDPFLMSSEATTWEKTCIKLHYA